MRIAVLSTEAEQIADRNIARTQGWPFFDEHDEDGLRAYDPEMVILLGWYVNDLQRMWKYRWMIAEVPKVVVLWAGSDILQCYDFLQAGAKQMFKDLKTDRFCHVPEHEWMKDELKKLFDLDSTDPLVSPVPKVFDKMPTPEEFTASIYSPMTRSDFYNLPMIGEALDGSDIPSIWYHFAFEYAPVPYKKKCDRRFAITRDEYEKVIADSSCAVRIPIHDGLSIGAAEFLMAGRPVVTCHDMPRYPKLIKGELTAEKVLNAITRIKNGEFVSDTVQQFYRDLFDPAKYKMRLQERLQTRWGSLSLDG